MSAGSAGPNGRSLNGVALAVAARELTLAMCVSGDQPVPHRSRISLHRHGLAAHKAAPACATRVFLVAMPSLSHCLQHLTNRVDHEIRFIELDMMAAACGDDQL